MNLIRLTYRRLYKDLQRKELVPLKILFAINISTLGVLYPYLTMHMRQLGMNVEEIGTVAAILPLMGIVVMPVTGLVADKIGDYRKFSAFASILCGTVTLLLLLIPVGRITVTYPQEVDLNLSCDVDRRLTLLTARNYRCVPAHPYSYRVEAAVKNCGFLCDHDFGFTLEDSPILPSTEEIAWARRDVVLKHAVNGYDAARNLSEFAYYFPKNAFGFANAKSNFSVSVSEIITTNEDSMKKVQRFKTDNVDASVLKLFRESLCTKRSSKADCVPSCLVTAPRHQMCQNPTDKIEYDPSFTYWMYVLVRILSGIIGGTALVMLEGAIMAVVREHNGDYGLQRVYASLGVMISCPLSGWLMDLASYDKHVTDFRPAFFLYALLKTVCGLMTLRIGMEFKKPAKTVVKDVMNVLLNVEFMALFNACFVLGSAWGMLESYLFWYLQDMGGTKSLMGATVTVGCLAGIPLMILAGPIIERMGHANVIFVGFFFYSVRLFGYSIIVHPWQCLIFDALSTFTEGLSFTAVVTYAGKLSTMTTDATIQGMVHGQYFAIGKGSGSLLGSHLISMVGFRYAFRISSALVLLAGIGYFLLNRFWLRHLRTKPAEDSQKLNF